MVKNSNPTSKVKKPAPKLKKSRRPQKQDLLTATSSSYMFNPAPIYSDQIDTSNDKHQVLKKKRAKERTKLQKRAELLEYMSSDDEALPKANQEAPDYGGLEHIDQDILGYFAVKATKIISQAEHIQEATYSQGTIVLGCVGEIGPNGNYLIINFTRNRKGFVSKDNLGTNGGHFHRGEYLLAHVLETSSNKLQLSCMPSLVNEGRRFADIKVGTFVNGIVGSADEFGYTISFESARFTGFVRGPIQLRIGKVYTLEVESKDTSLKVLVCRLPGVDTPPQDQVTRVLLVPGTVWSCQVAKVVEGGAIVRIDRSTVLGYVFADHMKGTHRKKVLLRLIGFDYHLKNLQFSLTHLKLNEYVSEATVGTQYSAVRVVEEVFGGSHMVQPVDGPLCFLHSSQLWASQIEDFERPQVGTLITKPCRIKEINYFDRRPVLTMKVSDTPVVTLSVGQLVVGTVKNILREDGNKVLVSLGPHQQAILPPYLQGDKQKLVVGGQVRARVVKIDQTRSSVVLTSHPLLRTVQAITSYEELQLGQQLTGFVVRVAENGSVVEFFGGITGFLTGSQLQVGQVVRVYVKYINAKDGKLHLSSTLPEPTEENEIVTILRKEKQAVANMVEALQLPTGELQEPPTFRVRKQQPTNTDLLLLSSKGTICVLLKEQSSHAINTQKAVLERIRSTKQPVTAITIGNMHGVPLVSTKFPYEEEELVVGRTVWGFIADATDRYILITLPLVPGQPTGILYLEQLPLKSIHYMQSVMVKIRKIVEKEDGVRKVYLSPVVKSECFSLAMAISHLADDRPWLQIGDTLDSTITMVKEYGVVVSLSNGGTGFIMNPNLLGGRTYIEGSPLTVQVLDTDVEKKVVDLREVGPSAHNGAQAPNYKDQNNSAIVLLSKELYSVVKLKNSKVIGFLWHDQSIYQTPELEFRQTVTNLKLINQQQLKASNEQKTRIHTVPIFIQVEANSENTQATESQLWKGQSTTGTVISLKGAYVYVRLSNGKQGRIHKSLFPIEQDPSKHFGYSAMVLPLIEQEIECTVISIKTRQTSHFTELSTIGKPKVKISGDIERDVGKELFGVIRSITPRSPTVVSLEMLGGHYISLNGWESHIVNNRKGHMLNEGVGSVGDLVKVQILKDHQGRMMGQALIPGSTVETSTIQIFRVVSHHTSYIRVQLANNHYASIDITELTDQWLPGVLEHFPVGHWGSCRMISDEEGSCRTEFIKESLWQRCMHPVTGSMLSFQKEVKAPPFDLRSLLFKNPSHSIEIGSLVLGYVTAVTDHGVFVKFGGRKEFAVLVPLQEVSDTATIAMQKNVPVLVLITRYHEGKWRGSMRYSLICKKISAQPQVGEIVEGVVTDVKNQRATLKLQGYLLQGELEKKNAEGNDGDLGWWTEKLVKKGTQIQAVVLSVKELKSGNKVVKLSNLKDLIEAAPIAKPKVKENTTAIEVYESLALLRAEYAGQQTSQIEVEEEEEEEVVLAPNRMELEQVAESDQEVEQVEEEAAEEEVVEEVPELDPETLISRAEFEKRIFTNPNSSELWVRYAAHVMEHESIEQARGVMERALRVINFVNEPERLNLWTSYLNLEYHYGQEERLVDLFKRGCESCNPKHLHLKLIDIYRKAQQFDLMVELAKSMVNKHKQSSKCWKELLLCLMEWHQSAKRKELPAYSLRDNLHRALQCLKKPKHVQILTYYGRLQFQFGQHEAAKTTFDVLINENPKRTDIFAQYVDLSAKYCPNEMTRSLFERALQGRLNTHKTKFLFKKWLEFESNHGTAKEVEEVQSRAQQWVQNYKKGIIEIESEEEEEQ